MVVSNTILFSFLALFIACEREGRAAKRTPGPKDSFGGESTANAFR